MILLFSLEMLCGLSLLLVFLFDEEGSGLTEAGSLSISGFIMEKFRH